MNGHPVSDQWYPLDAETLQLVVQYDPFYRVYVDSLALIHDLICEFTDPPEKPRLMPSEVIEQQARLVRIPHSGSHDPTTLMKNVEDNFGLAWKLRNRVERSESVEERFEAELMATQFMSSLLETYTTLSILKQYGEPAHL